MFFDSFSEGGVYWGRTIAIVMTAVAAALLLTQVL